MVELAAERADFCAVALGKLRAQLRHDRARLALHLVQALCDESELLNNAGIDGGGALARALALGRTGAHRAAQAFLGRSNRVEEIRARALASEFAAHLGDGRPDLALIGFCGLARALRRVHIAHLGETHINRLETRMAEAGAGGSAPTPLLDAGHRNLGGLAGANEHVGVDASILLAALHQLASDQQHIEGGRVLRLKGGHRAAGREFLDGEALDRGVAKEPNRGRGRVGAARTDEHEVETLREADGLIAAVVLLWIEKIKVERVDCLRLRLILRLSHAASFPLRAEFV